MRTKTEYDLVCRLHSKGLNQTRISFETGIPRGTIKDWLKQMPKNFQPMEKKFELKQRIISNKNFHDAYSYLLGLYLGDGYINACKRTFRLRIFLDEKYSHLNNYAKNMMEFIFADNSVSVYKPGLNHICIGVYNSELIDLFPQHGFGNKWQRKIELKDWQNEILNKEFFLKGLIHSDGCFYEEKINKKYLYERFMFSNKSIDLHEIFQNICNSLNIEYDFQHKGNTNGVWQTRIAKKESVKKLKQIIGTKEMPM